MSSGSVNYRRKTVCACCAWRPQGIATTILRLRWAIVRVDMIIHRPWGCPGILWTSVKICAIIRSWLQQCQLLPFYTFCNHYHIQQRIEKINEKIEEECESRR